MSVELEFEFVEENKNFYIKKRIECNQPLRIYQHQITEWIGIELKEAEAVREENKRLLKEIRNLELFIYDLSLKKVVGLPQQWAEQYKLPQQETKE